MSCGCCKKAKSQSSCPYACPQSQTDNGCDRVKLNCGPCIDITASEIPYLWFPSLQSVRQLDYVRKLECEFESLQRAFLSLTTHFARMQFRLRQIVQAAPEERDSLLHELEKVAFTGMPDTKGEDELPHMQRDLRSMGDVRRKQSLVIEKLRSQLTALAEASEMEGTVESGGGMTPSGVFPTPEICEHYAMKFGHADSSIMDLLDNNSSKNSVTACSILSAARQHYIENCCDECEDCEEEYESNTSIRECKSKGTHGDSSRKKKRSSSGSNKRYSEKDKNRQK